MPSEEPEPERIHVGDIYEDCAFHPVLCTRVDYEVDKLEGISLIDGSAPRSCSLRYCGPFRLTVEDALAIKEDLEAYVASRVAEIDKPVQPDDG